MLVGVVLGIFIALLVAALFVVLGAYTAVKLQVIKANEELTATRISLGRFVLLEQERIRIKESINVGFTEEQINTLANRISGRVKTLYDAEQQAALGRLD